MEETRKERLRYFGFAAFVGILLLAYVLGFFRTVFGVDTAAVLALLAGYRIFYNAISALLDRRVSADLAICIAAIAALLIGEYLAAAEAMFIMLVGEGLEGYAAGRTEAAIHRFVERLPRRATLLRDGVELEVDASSLAPGDMILVRAGERIPADGVIVQGASSLDESTITGEALPSDKQPGGEVFSGTLNGHGLLRVGVTRAGSDTTLARVIRLVEEAKQKRAPVERIADRYARYFLPALLLAGALTFYFTRDWLRTVAVLIVACPCALILATPTAMVAAIGGLARRGILVRGGGVLQAASRTDSIVFDKTGTVTEGQFEIVKIIPLGRSESELLSLVAAAERGSDHMLARVIVDEARQRGLAILEPDEARILPGRGAECRFNGRTLRAGSAAYLAEHGIAATSSLLEEADRIGATAVLAAEDGTLAGAILLRDRVRTGVREAVSDLERDLGIAYQLMLTGDRRRAAESIAREIGISNVEAELLPEQKLDRVRQLVSQGRHVAMVGDGINDAPALAAASVGVAVAGASDITAEAADVVYLGHSLEKLPRFFDVSRQATAIAWQNIILFAGAVNAGAVALAAWGTIGPIGAAVTHQLSSLFVMLNSLRLLRAGDPIVPQWASPNRLAGLSGTFHKWAGAIDPGAAFHFVAVRRRKLIRPILAAAAALVILNGLYVLPPDEVGVIERYGKKILPHREPGLHYKLPWPVEKLTRVQANRVRAAEIGFRSGSVSPVGEPAAYEWNVQHRSGRFQKRPEESLMLAGDQNMIEVNATIHYRIARPDDYLFRQLDGEATVRTAAESVLRSVVAAHSLDDVLTAGRAHIQETVRRELQERLDRYGAGVGVLRVRLLDVHPSLEVVDAFRDVSGAFEEKVRVINEAEGYRNEQVALARGGAEARVEIARGYSLGRTNRAGGDATRFAMAESASRSAPELTRTRLYLETMEQVLPARRKFIVDSGSGRRHLLMMEDGVLLGPSGAALLTAPPGAQGER